MTLHPDRDSADENDGKYRTNEAMTFEGVLKTSLRERAEHKATLDDLVKKDRGPTPLERREEKRRNERQATAKREREEIARREYEALADAVGDAHTSDQADHPSFEIATGETTQIGLHTTYEFATTEIDDQRYYYLVQITQRSYQNHHGELAVKGVGKELSYAPLSISATSIQNQIDRQRKEDLRANRDPVAWLTDAQLETIDEWYRARVMSELHLLEHRLERSDLTVDVLDQCLVVDADEESLLIGNDLRSLTSRQRTVVTESLAEIVEANVELPLVLYTDLHQSADYPLVAEIVFDQ